MVAAAPLQGIGTSVAFGTTTYEGNIKLLSISGPNLERGMIDTTNMATTVAKTQMQEALYSIGEMEMSVEHQYDASTDIPPVLDTTVALESVTINWAGLTTGKQWHFDGAIIGYTSEVPHDDKMLATIRVAASGPLTTS